MAFLEGAGSATVWVERRNADLTMVIVCDGVRLTNVPPWRRVSVESVLSQPRVVGCSDYLGYWGKYISEP